MPNLLPNFIGNHEGLESLISCGLIKMSIEPTKIPFTRPLQSVLKNVFAPTLNDFLDNKDAVILHNNELYYADIKNKRVKKINPSEDTQAAFIHLKSKFSSDYQIATKDDIQLITSLTGRVPFDESAGPEEIYRIHARNLLKHLVRGTPLCYEAGDSHTTSPLNNDIILNTLLVKRKKELMDALRVEMQQMLIEAYKWIQDPNNKDETLQEQCELFINNILSAYPFLDPIEGEVVAIPKKRNGTWILVEYTFEKIDISPRTGPLSAVIEDEDRIYAYGLVTKSKDMHNHLLFMGTTYPGGQGSGLADLYNLKPMHSVGEAHSFKAIENWLKKQVNPIIVSGHSKGATMAMIAAAKWQNLIQIANCFNPTGLHKATLNRYMDKWVNNKDPNKPEINVVINEGDIVPYIDDSFLPETEINRIEPNTDKPSMNFYFPSFLTFLAKGYEAHIHHYAGRDEMKLKRVNIEEINQNHWRHLLTDLKNTLSWLLFPVFYVTLFVKIIARKAARFYEENKTPIMIFLGLLGLALGLALAFTGFGAILATSAAVFLNSLLVSLSLPVLTTAVAETIACISLGLGATLAPLILVETLNKITPLVGKVVSGLTNGVLLFIGVLAGTIGGLIDVGIHVLLKKFTDNKNTNERNASEIRGNSDLFNNNLQDNGTKGVGFDTPPVYSGKGTTFFEGAPQNNTGNKLDLDTGNSLAC